jgi:hypothetical protein
MRGASPAIPERAGAHPSISDDRTSASVSAFVVEPLGARHEGDSMNTAMRRTSQQRQMPRRSPNGGNARQHYERYLARAREAQLAGDVVEMENCYQHAEHYLRVMRGEDHEHRGHV